MADITASRAGDDEAYARLVRRYERQIASLVWRFTRDAAQCEELVQQVFVDAYFSLRTYRGREQARQQHRVSLTELDAIEVAREDQIDAAEASGILHALLARLNAPDRLVLTLMYFEDCGTQEIAERMGWSRANVKTRALRARRRIKEIAEQEELLEKLGWTR